MKEKTYWQSLEEYGADRDSLAEQKGREFPENHVSESLSTTRRDFLKMLGLGFTAGALSGCEMPVQKALPYLNKPEELTPGEASYYATTCAGCEAGCGLLVKQRDGRPIKIEGNPEHPLSRGGTCAVGQATVLSIYNSARLSSPLKDGHTLDLNTLDTDVIAGLKKATAEGKEIVLLSGPLSSPSAKKLISEWQTLYPTTRHIAFAPLSVDAIREAYRLGRGKRILPSYRFDKAALTVSLDADFLGTWISPVEFARQYADARRLSGKSEMSRHIQFETGMSLTGSNADRRVPVAPSERPLVALRLLEILTKRPSKLPTLPETVERALADTAAELLSHRGRSLVVSGSHQVEEQLAVLTLNEWLGSHGKTIDLATPSLQRESNDAEFAALLSKMEKGSVGALVIWGANPVYAAKNGPAFAEAMKKVELTIRLGLTLDETARSSRYVVPTSHFLESWSDASPKVGLYAIAQPLIMPILKTRSAEESLLRFMDRRDDYDDYLKAYWQDAIFPKQRGHADFTSFWNAALQNGFWQSGETDSLPSPQTAGVAIEAPLVNAYTAGKTARDSGDLELALYSKVGLRDGTWADNPWLQELPDPVSKVTWANYAAISPNTAAARGLEHGDIVSVKTANAAISLPVFVQPGQAGNTVSIAVGYGRSCGNQAYGQNAYPLSGASSVSIEKTGERYAFATTQMHGSMEGRPILIEATLADYRNNPKSGHPEFPEPETLWTPHELPGHSWGMAIDLSSCVGCGACTIACQAENNVPVVGEDEMRRNREMHWIRIDRYYSENPENPEVAFQPMLCQHCENAPCETVCPVLATVHSSEGLNQQVYNRCVGTRYCANNCPYKVRRFNWFNYAKDEILDDSLAHMVLNPDVSVRSRGVMEKCSMCAQRIQAGKTVAKREGRDLKDGDIKMACEQSCPADAIVFGDMNDPESRVSKQMKDPRLYQVLEEIGTRPAVRYLSKVRNT